MKHNILILLLVIFLSACSDATVRIVEYPRFVHEGTDPVPTKRNNTYPATFDADMAAADASCVGIGKRIAGFDHEMQYIKEEGPFADKLPDDDERFVQYLETVTEQDPNCRGARSIQEKDLLEYFHPRKNYDVIERHICNESYFKYTIKAKAGLVDLDDLPNNLGNRLPAVNSGQNVAGLFNEERSYAKGAVPPPFMVTPTAGWSSSDLTGALNTLNRTKSDSVISWELSYEFNGCGPVAAGTHTLCSKVHCWEIKYSDSKVKNKRESRSED